MESKCIFSFTVLCTEGLWKKQWFANWLLLMSLRTFTRAPYRLQRLLSTLGLTAGLPWLIRQMCLKQSCGSELELALSLCCIKESSVRASAINPTPYIHLTVGHVGSRRANINENVCWACSIVEGLRWLEAHILIDFLALAPDEHLQAAQSWAQNTQTLGCWLSWLPSSLAGKPSRCMCVSGSLWHGKLWTEIVGPLVKTGLSVGSEAVWRNNGSMCGCMIVKNDCYHSC